MSANTIDRPAALKEVPPLPPGAPTLSRHLHWALNALGILLPSAERDDVATMGPATVTAFNDAVTALERLPSVTRAERTIDGVLHIRDEGGRWVPAEYAHPSVLLQDDFVCQAASAALALHQSLARFKALTMGEGIALVELIGEQYGIKVGGDVGNVTFYSFDRQYQLRFARADRITFGPEIQAARELLERWVAEEDGSPALKLLINRAFGFDQEGKIRAAEVFRLATYDLPGATWAQAIKAIRDSVQIIGKAEYMRVYRRVARGKYELIPLDLASV